MVCVTLCHSPLLAVLVSVCFAIQSEGPGTSAFLTKLDDQIVSRRTDIHTVLAREVLPPFTM